LRCLVCDVMMFRSRKTFVAVRHDSS
jgi:hypothetical protein